MSDLIMAKGMATDVRGGLWMVMIQGFHGTDAGINSERFLSQDTEEDMMNVIWQSLI